MFEWYWKVNKATTWCSRTPWHKWVNGCSLLSHVYHWLWCLIQSFKSFTKSKGLVCFGFPLYEQASMLSFLKEEKDLKKGCSFCLLIPWGLHTLAQIGVSQVSLCYILCWIASRDEQHFFAFFRHQVKYTL